MKITKTDINVTIHFTWGLSLTLTKDEALALLIALDDGLNLNPRRIVSPAAQSGTATGIGH